MLSSAEKTNNHVAHLQRKKSEPAFFRKAGDESFFGTKETPSFFNAPIQAKLSVSNPDDPQEKEADAMADQVMRMAEPTVGPPQKEEEKLQRKEDEKEETVQTKQLPSGSVQRVCESCAKEEKAQPKLFRMIHRSSNESLNSSEEGNTVSETEHTINRKNISIYHSDAIQRSGRGPPVGSIHFEQSLSSSKGSGGLLPQDTRQFMESRFNADFSNVRIHTGSHAESMSSQIHAQAFTHGSDIYFNTGKYSPLSQHGSSLLAHELTHTIQQGASKQVSSSAVSSSQATSVSTKPISVSRKEIIHRSADGVPVQLTNAVAKAKTMEGKINAKQPGPDGYRTGWQHLLEIFKTTFGEDRIISGSGGTAIPGTVAEMDIKKYREAKGVQVVDPANTDRTMTGNRDSMPSWCGIFVFWALNKCGVPMPKWELGKNVIKPEAINPKGYIPKPGDIAWRKAYSHFAIVESVSGETIKTVNGNTAGADNMGGQVQTVDHKLDNWTAFFSPLMTTTGPLTTGEAPVNSKPKSFKELRKEIFKVNRKGGGEQEEKNITEEEQPVQAKPELSNWSVDGNGGLQTGQEHPGNIKKVQPKEEEKKEEDKQELINQPAVQKKQAYEIYSKCDECNKESKNEQSKFPVQLKTEETNSSLNSYTNAETSEHSVEKDRGPPLQAKLISGNNIIQRSVIDDALEFAGSVTDCISIDLDKAKACGLQKAQQVAMHIPGYKALRVVLGKDPITDQYVERNGRNFIEAAFDIMPGGSLLHKKLDEQHQLDAAAAWIDGKIAEVETIVNGLFSAITNFWDGLGVRDFTSPLNVLRRGANIVLGFVNNVIDFAVRAAKELLEMVKKFLLGKIVEFIKEKTTAYPLLTVILGEDPITKEKVARNGTNILNALLELGGEEGKMQRDQMKETGTFQKVVGYIDEGIKVFGNLYDTIVQNFGKIWDMVTIEALMEPVETFTKIYNIFADPVKKVLDFVIRVVAEILKLIKDVLFKRISEEAKKTRGYFLVTVIINKDPFTGEVVPRTIENIIHGFMSLMDGGEEQFQQMKESGAIDKATAKINAAVKKLNMTPQSIIQLFIDLWNSFSFRDFLHPIETFKRIIAKFGEPIVRLIAFVVEIVKIVVEVILIIMNFPFDLINRIIANAMKAFHLIKADPIGFLKNLLRAIKEGFIQFFDNILKHLISGLVGWLTSELKDAGVPELKDLSLKGIISWVMEVLGISMEKIWEKLAKHPKIGPAKVAKIRSMINTLTGIWTFIKDVQERGMAAIWDKIQEQLSNLWNTILDSVKNWIMQQIVEKIVTKLLSMLDPTGIMAVVNSVIALYKAIQSFLKYLREMLEIVNSFVEGVVEIASGNTKKAADFLERSLARAVPIIIGFLANQVGLSGIGKRIGELIGKAREMVDKALDWLVNKAVDMGGKLLEMGKAAVAGITDWWKGKKELKTKDGVMHSIYFTGTGPAAQLMIATTPMTVKAYLNKVKTDNKLKDEDIQKPLATVDKMEKKEKETPATDELKTKQTNEMSDLMAQLATELAELPLEVSGTNSGAIYGGTYQGAFGASAIVAYQEAPFTIGSKPDVDHPMYSKINNRKDGGGSYYVKGHLLNENLGGPGTNWANLTPINRDANKDHQLSFEDKVKDAVNGMTSGVSASKLGYMKGFSVTASYGRGDCAALTHLNDDSQDDPPAGADPNWNMNELKELLEGEKAVPNTLNCSATIKKQGATAEQQVSYTVTNNISYGVLSQYQLGLRPKKAVILANCINPSFTTDTQMENSFKAQNITGIGPARAKRIYDTFKQKGKITNGKADIGIGLQALNNLNASKNLVITSGNFSWPASP